MRSRDFKEGIKNLLVYMDNHKGEDIVHFLERVLRGELK